MPTASARAGDEVVLDLSGLQALIDVLRADGRTVVGPTVRDGAITYAAIESIEALPRGVGDEQDAGHYRLRERGDAALFGYASGAQSFKPWLFPARQLLWSGQRTADGFTIEPADTTPPRLALLGVRGCDLRAIAVHDRVLGSADRPAADAHYTAARADLLVVAVACAEPSGTCFCASMGTGPHPGGGADLVLTELDVGTDHRFLAEVVTERGAAVYYMTIAGQSRIFKAGLALSPELPLAQPGDTVTLTFLDTGQNVVTLTNFSDQSIPLSGATPTPAATP